MGETRGGNGADPASGEAVLRALEAYAPVGVAMFDRELRYLSATRRWVEEHGLAGRAFLGRPMYELHPLAAQWREVHRRCLEGGGAAAEEEPFPQPGGTVRWVRWECRPWYDAAGAVGGVVLASEDVSERRRATLAAQHAEREANLLFELAPAGVVLSDAAGRLRAFNRKAHEQLGYTREEFARLRIADVDADDRPGDFEQRLATVVAGRELDFETRHRTKDGALRDVRVRSLLVADEPEVRFLSAWDDVTERNAALRRLQESEARVRHSEQRFRALIEKATDLVSVLDAQGRYTYWGPSALQALGFEAADVIGISCLDLVHPDDRAAAAAALAELLGAPDATTRVVVHFRHRDGSWRLLEVFGRNLLQDPAVEGIVLNAHDVTEQHRLEEQVRQSQKLDSVGRLAGGVAHDFNNLLTVILGCADGLASDLSCGRPASREDVDEIRAAGERARELTRQLLAFARKQVISPRAFDLADVVLRSEKLLRRVVGEDIAVKVIVDPGPGPFTIRADPAQLEQVIMNLAVNARDAMPEGGRLWLEVGPVEVDAALALDHPGLVPGPHVRLSVRDTGMGMAPDVVAHAFEPFFTTKGPGRGTGLGLATVHGIVAQAGGSVRLESRPGAGTTVDLFFARVEEAPAANPAPRPLDGPGGTETVLVVEDDDRVRRVAVQALSARGYRVLDAADGPRALAAARALDGPLHLLVSDVIMPGQHGRAVAEQVVLLHPGARVLFVSGHPQDVIARRGVLDPGVHFLPKPFTPAGLAGRVREVLDGPPPPLHGPA